MRGIHSSFIREAEAQARFEATSQQARRHLGPSRLIVKGGAHNAGTAAAAVQPQAACRLIFASARMDDTTQETLRLSPGQGRSPAQHASCAGGQQQCGLLTPGLWLSHTAASMIVGDSRAVTL